MSAERPTQMQNCTWPLLRRGRAWRRGSIKERAESALKHLVRSMRGQLLWAPDYGWILEEIRAQGWTIEEADELTALLSRAAAYWLPYVRVLQVIPVMPPNEEKADIHVRWDIPLSWSTQGAKNTSLGPWTTVVST